jgi:DNA-binding NarL/FixJ family response regulator
MEALTRARLHKANDDPARILLVSGSSSRRKALSGLVTKSFQSGAVNVVTAGSFPAGQAGVAVDLVVADVDGSSLAASLVRFLGDNSFGAGAVALIDDPDPRWVQLALQAGLNAILSRDPTGDDLHLALAAADSGLILLHPSSARGLVTTVSQPLQLNHDYEQLTSREFEVLRLLSEGLGNKEIASRLAISEHTAKFHISSILGKLGAASRTEAVSQGIRRGLIPI